MNDKNKENYYFMNKKTIFSLSKCLLAIFLIIVPGTFIQFVNVITNINTVKWNVDYFSKLSMYQLLSMVVVSLQISFPMIFIIGLSKESFNEYGFNKIEKKEFVVSILRLFLNYIVIMFIIGIIIAIIQYILKINLINTVTEYDIRDRKSNISLFVLSIVPLFLSAFTEELCFRSYFYNNLNKIIQNKWMCIIITNILFSLGHIYQGVYGCIYSFALGMAMSIEYKNKNNIYTIIIFHLIMNICSFAIRLI
jgi:membrane protease YdiL (CAAX protease family)